MKLVKESLHEGLKPIKRTWEDIVDDEEDDAVDYARKIAKKLTKTPRDYDKFFDRAFNDYFLKKYPHADKEINFSKIRDEFYSSGPQ